MTANVARDRRRGVTALVVGVALVLLIADQLLPTFQRQSQYAALRTRGVVTVARIEYCSTDTSGRPSTTTVRCPGTFTVDRKSVTEDILGLPKPLETGDEVAVLADPKNVRDVYPTVDVRSGYGTGWRKGSTAYAALAAVLLGLVIVSQLIVVHRRRRSAA